MLRRGLVPVVLVAVVGALAWGVTRITPRSPVTILVVCALAVLVMKLVENRVARWFRRWEEMDRRRRAGRRP